MRLSLAGWLLLFSTVGFAQTGLPLLRYYEADFGGRKSIWSIAQDNSGVLYLATGESIMQYDGVAFTTLNDTPAYGLVKDESGVIYVSGNNEFGFLESSPAGHVRYRSLMHLVDSSVKIGVANNVYATKEKVYCIAGKITLEYDKKTHTMIAHQLEPGAYYYNGFVKKDTMWISVCYRGLRYFKDGKLHTPPNGESFLAFQKGCMNCSLKWQNDQRVLVYGQSLVRYHGNHSPPTLFRLKSSILSRSVIQNSVSINSNYHLLTTVNKGAILFDTLGRVLNRYHDSTRLHGNNITYAFADPTNNIWLAFNNSRSPIVKTEHGQDISLWDKTFNLTGSVLSMLRFHGVTYISTDDGLFYIDEDGHIHKFSFPLQYIQSLASFKTATGDKLIAVFDGNRVCEIENGKIKELLKGFDVNQIVQSSRNPSLLYVCDQDKFGYLKYVDGSWTYHEVTKIFENMTLVEDPDGSLWLNNESKSALLRVIPLSTSESFTVKSVARYTAKNGLPGTPCQPILYNHQVLFGTPSGVYSWDAGSSRFQPWHKAGKKFRDLLSRTSLLFSDPAHQAIHLLVDKKLVTLSIHSNGDTSVIFKPYKRFGDLGGINNLLVDEAGMLWVAGLDGVIRYDKSADIKNYEQGFDCLIRKVVIGQDSTVFWGGVQARESTGLKLSLNHGFEKLTIRFAAPFYDKEEETQYSYQLVGRDSQWSEWSTVTTKEYDDDLWEGSYTFRVKAKNIYETESREASFSFVIHPPWFRSWWAYGIYAGLTLLAMMGMVRWRTRNLNDKKKHLESLVSSQTRELREFNESLKASQHDLERSNEELLTTNDFLKKTQKQLVESEKMASLGQLTAGIAHEINNPINFISGGVQALAMVQQELLTRGQSMTNEELDQLRNETAALMQSINNGVNRTAKIISSLRIFSSPVETIDEEGKVNVKECVEGALVLLGSKIARENIVITRDYQHRSGAKANSPQLSQVVINLVDNAIFELAKIDAPRRISITTTESDADIIIKIKDNAGGIPEQIQDHVFEPFFTTKEVGSGTGLGLSICYSIIEKHKGKIFFISTPGEGTEFVITLPKGDLIVAS